MNSVVQSTTIDTSEISVIPSTISLSIASTGIAPAERLKITDTSIAIQNRAVFVGNLTGNASNIADGAITNAKIVAGEVCEY